MDEMIYRGEDWGKGEGEEIVKREGELCYIIRPFSNSFRLRLNKKYGYFIIFSHINSYCFHNFFFLIFYPKIFIHLGFNDLPKVTAQMVIQDLGLFLKKYQVSPLYYFIISSLLSHPSFNPK